MRAKVQLQGPPDTVRLAGGLGPGMFAPEHERNIFCTGRAINGQVALGAPLHKVRDADLKRFHENALGCEIGERPART